MATSFPVATSFPTATTSRVASVVNSTTPTSRPANNTGTTTSAAATPVPQEPIGTLVLLRCGVAVSASAAPPWCLVPHWNASVRAVFGPDALVVGLANGTATLDCPNFVCPPCADSRRRLLSDNTTAATWQLVFQWYQPVPMDPAPFFVNLTVLDPTIPGGSASFVVMGQRAVSRAAAGAWVAIQSWADTAAASLPIAEIVGGVAALAVVVAVAAYFY
jgi:hypothetical protein